MNEKEIEEMRKILKIRNGKNISKYDIVKKINKLIENLEDVKEASGIVENSIYIELLDSGNFEVGIRIPEFVIEDREVIIK